MTTGVLRAGVDTLWLNVLWLLGALTVVGLPASTVATIAVARRIQDGEQPAVTAAYLAALRRGARAATLIGGTWALLGLVLVLDVLLLPHLGTARVPMTVVLVPAALLYVPLAAYLACVVAREPDVGLRRALRLSIALALARPLAAMQVLLAVGGGAVVIHLLPLAALVVPALVVHSVVLAWRLALVPLTRTPGAHGAVAAP